MPGGELSVDSSGPRSPGRWPSDTPGSSTKRAIYFLVGAYQTFTEEEQKQRAADHLAAADASGSIVTDEPLVQDGDKGLVYFVRPLETKNTSPTIKALQDIVNEVHCRYKQKVIFRMHSGRAKELCGERVEDHFRPQGIRITSTAGYEPNANGRAEGAVGILKDLASRMLQGLGPQGRDLWPLAVQHACWRKREGPATAMS